MTRLARHSTVLSSADVENRGQTERFLVFSCQEYGERPVCPRIIPLILLALWSVSPVFADDTVDAAVNRLSTVGQFAFGGVGYAGVISKGEIDFKVVVAQPKPTALNAYERLWVIGNPQGKSYALSGLKKLAPERFEELTATIAKSTKEVEVMRGCVISHEPLLEVAKQIGQGKFRF